mmetsp:Transcript_65461/g.122116  ORF Transcript_65461/g.122116 Transcript_65461/m.122116 type:complete len:94 (-) Transcript_65461:95-376(-)
MSWVMPSVEASMIKTMKSVRITKAMKMFQPKDRTMRRTQPLLVVGNSSRKTLKGLDGSSFIGVNEKVDWVPLELVKLEAFAMACSSMEGVTCI